MKQYQQQQQKQQQKQGYYMSQQHLKLMHIMHLSGYALQEYIANEVELNPVLEMEKESEIDIKNNDEDDPYDSEFVWDPDDDSFEIKYKNTPSNEEYYEAPIVQYYSLHENLKGQIHMLNLSEELTDIICYLIDELNDDGYLPRPLSEVTDDYGFFNGKIIEELKIENALDILQKCEPAGVGARDLRECLLLQLKRKTKKDKKVHELSYRLIDEEYQAFVQQQFSKIKNSLNISGEELENCINYISKLSPKPVTEINKYELLKEQIIPDFEVTIDDHELYISLTSSEFTKLLVNTEYVSKDIDVHNSIEKRQVEDYYKNLVLDANSLVSALKERETTMINVMKVIVQMQPDFFKSGDIKELKPMILQDIAKATNFDISTVSRITSNKHVQTPFGIFGLKNLFMRAIPSEKNDSFASTSIQVQDIIQQIIKKENKNKPFSDTHIMELLKEKEISIARRTVVKYRELAGVPNSTIRKKQETLLNE